MFYRRWILACATGELVGIGVATASAVALNTWIGVTIAVAVAGWVVGMTPSLYSRARLMA